MDTIFALSSARGKAGVAVVRVSGPGAFTVCKSLSGTLPAFRRASLRVLRTASGEIIDEALIVRFPRLSSFTGEDIVEFQTHGSMAVAAALLSAIGDVPGCRPAEPGEFTRRALENNRLDLAQVEGLSDLIKAETEVQRRQALRTFSGDLGKKCDEWRRSLIRAAALLEVTIDFVDEEVPLDVYPEVQQLVRGVIEGIESEIAGVVVAERVRHGFEVAILGRPNAGKSTLLNRLARREAAITSEIPGTTRDVIEVRMDIGGLPVTFLDTAGLRESDDQIEMLGIQRARDRAELADLRIHLVEPGEEPAFDPRAGDIVRVGKSDLFDGGHCGVSGWTGDGVADLLDTIRETLESRLSEVGLATHARHGYALKKGVEALRHTQDLLASGSASPELVSEELRDASRVLDGLVGRVGVEDVLDEIFSRFCLGK